MLDTNAYVVGDVTSPRYPCWPPPSGHEIEEAFALICLCRVSMEAYVGCPVILVRVGYWNWSLIVVLDTADAAVVILLCG